MRARTRIRFSWHWCCGAVKTKLNELYWTMWKVLFVFVIKKEKKKIAKLMHLKVCQLRCCNMINCNETVTNWKQIVHKNWIDVRTTKPIAIKDFCFSYIFHSLLFPFFPIIFTHLLKRNAWRSTIRCKIYI